MYSFVKDSVDEGGADDIKPIGDKNDSDVRSSAAFVSPKRMGGEGIMDYAKRVSDAKNEFDGKNDVRFRDGESVYQRALDVQQDFERRYKHSPILVIKDGKSAYGQSIAVGVSEEDARLIEKIAKDGISSAVYSPAYERMFIFAGNGDADLKTLFHENVHWAVDKLFSDRESDLNVLYDSIQRSFPKACESIRDAYLSANNDVSEFELRNEVVANVMEFASDDMGVLSNKLDDAGRSLLNEIIAVPLKSQRVL